MTKNRNVIVITHSIPPFMWYIPFHRIQHNTVITKITYEREIGWVRVGLCSRFQLGCLKNVIFLTSVFVFLFKLNGPVSKLFIPGSYCTHLNCHIDKTVRGTYRLFTVTSSIKLPVFNLSWTFKTIMLCNLARLPGCTAQNLLQLQI